MLTFEIGAAHPQEAHFAFPDNVHHTVDFADDRFTFGVARFKQLFDTGQTLRNIIGAGHTTRMEGAQRQLGARLTDRLGRNNPDGLTGLDLATTGQIFAIAALAQTETGFTGQWAAHKSTLDLMPLNRRQSRLIEQVIAGQE